jgi:putative hydrolase of the HAD superfamily
MLEIDAVAFDLDGTLYPNYRFYGRIFPFAVREYRLLSAFGKARNTLRAATVGSPLFEQEFYEAQAFLTEQYLNRRTGKIETQAMKQRIENLIYRRWEPLFKKIKLFPHVVETLRALKDRGFKLGLLSDFPPEQKLEFLGLSGVWDTVLCSEVIGRLKPDPKSFLVLAEKLNTAPERVLYVGNSRRYDVMGAGCAGMKTALKAPFLLNSFNKFADEGNFVFSDYRYLYDYVIR